MSTSELESSLERIANQCEQLVALLDPARASMREPDWSAPAFRWRPDGHLQPVHHPHGVQLDQLRGIDSQKDRLLQNTHQFLAGKTANNALLWGARGTGKSSLIKAILNALCDRGLRLVEVPAHNLQDLPDITAPLRNRPERFILFADDLSFEAGDDEYKALKAVLDGSIAATPDNVVVYATSNRRHLLPEYGSENQQARNVNGEIHHGEAVEEKISLSERFGLWLSFYPFDQDQYLQIVQTHLQTFAADTSASPNEINRAALQWALARGSRSGRVAWQFARDWAGRQQLG